MQLDKKYTNALYLSISIKSRNTLWVQLDKKAEFEEEMCLLLKSQYSMSAIR